MPINRVSSRNVHFYNVSAPEVALGGLRQNGSVTERIFLEMLAIILVAATPVQVQRRASGYTLSMNDNRLEPGEYDISCDSECLLERCFYC